MAASQHHFNTINREYSKFSRAIIAIIGYHLKLLVFKFYSSKSLSFKGTLMQI